MFIIAFGVINRYFLLPSKATKLIWGYQSRANVFIHSYFFKDRTREAERVKDTIVPNPSIVVGSGLESELHAWRSRALVSTVLLIKLSNLEG